MATSNPNWEFQLPKNLTVTFIRDSDGTFYGYHMGPDKEPHSTFIGLSASEVLSMLQRELE